MVNEAVLSRVYLEAVLPCLELLTLRDTRASQLAARWNGSIRFCVGLSGPRCTVELRDSRATVTPAPLPRPDVGLFFPHEIMLNNLFRGKGLQIALPWKGLTKIKGLLTFSKLAERMQEVLESKDRETLELRAELMLGLMSRAIAVLARHDPDYKVQASHLHGVTEFRIRTGSASHVDFSGGTTKASVGRASSPDFILEFADSPLFLDVADDKVDVLAKACLGEISLKGDLHMGQIVNIALDKIGEYLL
ncbi:MAG: hypothetical protein MUD15_10835 [Desulfobacterota bacterium]|jgi:hypothetical protein|nr:hypothetical protein [Thermodesulfobacteriota bacterium]